MAISATREPVAMSAQNVLREFFHHATYLDAPVSRATREILDAAGRGDFYRVEESLDDFREELCAVTAALAPLLSAKAEAMAAALAGLHGCDPRDLIPDEGVRSFMRDLFAKSDIADRFEE